MRKEIKNMKKNYEYKIDKKERILAIVKKIKIAADCGLLILNAILLINKISILYINFLKKRKT
jgi:hypothetical protein